MKTINVSRLWEGIPAYYILSILGRELSPLQRHMEIQEIRFEKEVRFRLVLLETGEEIEIVYSPIPHFTENIQEYFSNPKNLLIFTHKLLDRVIQYRKVIGDIQSQYFERGRKRKYLDKYIKSHPLGIHVKPTIERIIGELHVQPPLIMWILECIRENFPLEEKEIQFETSDGERRIFLEDPQISDFPRIFAHQVTSPYFPVSFPSVPFYIDKHREKLISEVSVRNCIYQNKPVHSLFLQGDSLLDVYSDIAGRILRFINEYILIEPENLFNMTLEEAYYSSWNITKEMRPVISYVNLAEDIIIRHLKTEKSDLIAYGVEGSKYLKETTVREYLNQFYHELKS